MEAVDTAIISDMVHSAFRCLGCGDPLPRGRGGHCDACVEWETIPRHPALCEDCGRAFLTSGNRPRCARCMMLRLNVCAGCGGGHPIQQCPEIEALLTADEESLGACIFQHVHTEWLKFLRAYAEWDDEERYCVARPYAAYRGWAINQALDLFDRALGISANAREAA